MFKTSLAACAVVLLIVIAGLAVAQTPPAPPMVVDKVTSDLHVVMVSEFGWEQGGGTITASLEAMMAEVAR